MNWKRSSLPVLPKTAGQVILPCSHRVTCRIKEGIEKKEFEDNARMEKLDVLFANRYIDAWKRWRAGQPTTLSWKLAFETAAKSNTVIMQHLLMGINAHINLDLGIAAAETMQGYPLQGIQKDFNSINAILAALVDEVQANIGKVSPLMFVGDRCAKGYDEMLVCFSIDRARDGAWLFANEVYGKTGPAYNDCVDTRDRCIAVLGGKLVITKGFLSFIMKIVRWFEWRQPRDVTNRLKYVVKQAADKI